MIFSAASTRFRFHFGLTFVTVMAVVGVLCGNDGFAVAAEPTTPVVGSFSVGAGATGEVDERTGAFATQISLAALPGVRGDAVSVGFSYAQDLAALGGNPAGVGVGWMWNMPQVMVDGGVRVVTPSGGVYAAADGDSSAGEQSSGLEQYLLDDLVFSQVPGELAARSGVVEAAAYAYSLEHVGGMKDYFNASGHLLARIDAFAHRIDWLWGDDGRFAGVVDDGGSRIDVQWTGVGVNIVSPVVGGDALATTRVEIRANRLVAVTNSVDENVTYEYNGRGLLERIVAGSGAATVIEYAELSSKQAPGYVPVVRKLRVVDSTTGHELSQRTWEILGDNTPQGWPKYSSASELWGSGDGEYRYSTEVSDGSTRVRSQYNSLGSMVSRNVTVATSGGDFVAQEQTFVYPDTHNGGVPDKQKMPKQYAKPVQMQVVIRDKTGRVRTTTQQTTFDNAGRATRHVSSKGTVTETVYDAAIPNGARLSSGLVLQETVTGRDGPSARTINTPTADGKSISSAQTYYETAEGSALASHTEQRVDSDGFVSEKRVVSVRESNDEQNAIITRFYRVIDDETVTVSQTDAAGTSAESTHSTVVDKATGLLVAEIDPSGRRSSTRYDAASRVIEHTDATGGVTKSEYEKNVNRATDPLGVTRSEYVDVLGRLVKITNNIGLVDGVAFPIDGREQVIEKRRYDGNGSRITTTDAYGLETVSVSDVFGRPVEVITPNRVRHLTVHDDVAQTTSTGLVAGHGGLSEALRATTTKRDDEDRIVEESGVRADGVVVPTSSTTFDALGRVTRSLSADLASDVIFDPNGTPRTTTVTPTNPEVFDGDAVTATREHDAFGVPTKKTLSRDGGEQRSGMSRVVDAAGRTLSETDQAGAVKSYSYTTDGHVAETRETATGRVTRNTYDPRTRALTLSETVAPDEVVSAVAFEHDTTGRPVSVYDPSNRAGTEIRYTHDVFGNTVTMVYPDGKRVAHRFNEHGRQLSDTDVVGNVTTYTHDEYGAMVGATQIAPNGSVLGDVKYEYDDLGRMTELARGNGVTSSYTFTAADELATETTTNGTSVIAESTYVYDTHGNLLQRIDTRNMSVQTPGQTGESAEHASTQGPSQELTTETTAYSYDAYDRLTSSRVYEGDKAEGTELRRTDYETNVSGDVTREIVRTRAETDGPPTTTDRQFEYNTSGHLTAITTNGERVHQEYDAAGNLTLASDGTRYTYNSRNQPVTETRADGTTVKTSYWTTQQRSTTETRVEGVSADNGAVNETQNSPLRHTIALYWDDSTIINDIHSETDVATNGAADATPVAASYLIGASRHARTLSAATPNTKTVPNTDVVPNPTATDRHEPRTEYYVADRHANIVATTSAEGKTTASYAYADYGHSTTLFPRNGVTAETGADRNPFQHASEYTTDAGIQILGQRTYDPEQMRFTTRDTLELHNLYAYANANPITFVDPSGNKAEWDEIVSGLFAWAGTALAFTSVGLAAFAPVTAPFVLTFGLVVGAVADSVMSLLITLDTTVKELDFLLTTDQADILGFTSLAIGVVTFGYGLAHFLGKIPLTESGNASAIIKNSAAGESETLLTKTDSPELFGEQFAKAQRYFGTLGENGKESFSRLGQAAESRRAVNVSRADNSSPASAEGAIVWPDDEAQQRFYVAVDHLQKALPDIRIPHPGVTIEDIFVGTHKDVIGWEDLTNINMNHPGVNWILANDYV